MFPGTNSRYFDTYTGTQTSARVGDALGNASTTNPGCAGWHSASVSLWVYSYYPYFVRGNKGIFSFDHVVPEYNFYCRGVAVCGAGL